MGIETEYSIYSNQDTGNLINAMIEHLRGEPMGLDRRSATSSRCFLKNGGLVYKDMGAPEYCTPECPNPKSLVAFDRAGEIIVQKLARAVSILKECKVSIFKKGSDGYGHPSGCHENYSVSPELFLYLTKGHTSDVRISVWSTFLAVRQLITGGGKVGSERSDMPATFQISQRADFIVAFRNDDTLQDRPVIQCRDEPLARHDLVRRLHVIVGDPNLCEWALFLKVGLSALMLMALEDNYFSTANIPVFSINTPLMFPIISRDVELKQKHDVTITNSADKSLATATEILCAHVEALSDYLATEGWRRLTPSEYLIYQDVIDKARFILSRLLNQDMRSLLGICDWATKLVLANQYLGKKSKTLADCSSDLELELNLRTFVDMGYSSTDQETSLSHHLFKKGLMKRIVSDEDINLALTTTPKEGRAPLRVAITDKFNNNIKTIFWDKIILFEGGEEFTIELPTPFIYNNDIFKQAILSSRTPKELWSAWTALLPIGV
ncbi:MAG: hypothetical protein UT29_C0001G0140 [Candidatus Yanofskybacteria bacterium GW2011_GWA1_39_13]|uniref:Proteasome component n=2 Tax=Patescibacteria group TaxID=1783273 RepID=A0A0G0PWY9_YANXG|nr:MAG: hypothetical protein UT29_C0001G0140 [Candidatus Yanofskybacteria bacterium GW2011_GWA1_39_13]